jgi:hypothetical protein
LKGRKHVTNHDNLQLMQVRAPNTSCSGSAGKCIGDGVYLPDQQPKRLVNLSNLLADTVINRTMIGLKGLALAALIGVGAVMMNKPHSEDALMADWSDPPPFPIFIAVNLLAGILHSMGDALTPPPIRMNDIALGYQTTILAHICEKFTIPDYLASGPKTIAEIAQHMQMTDLERVERLMYALASEGMTKLDKKSPDKNALCFVNSALSATLRSDHPNSMRGMVGHNAQDVWNAWGSLPLMFGVDAVDNAWDLAWPEHPIAKGGIWSLYEADDAREEQFGRAMKGIESLGGWAMAKDGPFEKA